ncbi:MAG: hypothetical protein IKJ88_00775 [Clostridia bacterium]|nr:hypothetical protein [Clostridia bacterium]
MEQVKKLQLPRRKDGKCEEHKKIRVRVDNTMDIQLKALCFDTGLPMEVLAGKLLKFALENCEVV